MAQLKSADILGEIAKEERVAEPRPAIPADDIETRKQSAVLDGAGKLSPYRSDLREKLRRKQQFNLGMCPSFVIEEFEKLRQAAKMNKREFLYHLLREAGADIPPYKDMDGRKF